MNVRQVVTGWLGLLVFAACAAGQAQEELPFQYKIEVYRSAEEDLAAFTVRLEQPFLAEEFEKSNYLRLVSDDERAYLIYPKETRFQQKHAEFYGRLRGEGKAALTLVYETVSENIDGSRQVHVRQGKLELTVPPPPPADTEVGSRDIFLEWAREQNRYFAQQLEYYPTESFFQYCLLQSKARYGVDPPPIPRRAAGVSDIETELYEVFTGSLAIQETLQQRTLGGGPSAGDQTIHISQLQPPQLQSLDYEQLLKEQAEEGVEPNPHAMARLIPADQYFLHFRSMQAFENLVDLSDKWGDSLLRLYTIRAQDNRVRARLEEQLCLQSTGLTQLFADQAVSELALTGGDPFLVDGTDVTIVFHVQQPDVFQKETTAWLEQARRRHPDLVSREFNYRGHLVTANYTNDRVVSSFLVRHEDFFIYSNSHRAVRRIIDVSIRQEESLLEALDYRYVTTILAPLEAEDAGYMFVSESAIQRLIGPEAKISQKRRRECFNNLVMLNNASLLYRWEYGRSPETLSELVQRRFVDPRKIVCPHGGAYAFDSGSDTCTCSLHNRLRYLTPNAELTVLQVSQQERDEYERYKQRYQAFWRQMFDPIAVRLTAAPENTRLEVCVLPLANGSLYRNLREMVDDKPREMDTAHISASALLSMFWTVGRERTAGVLRAIPGIAEVAREDPTLTDMSWLGDRVTLHVCDGATILEIDPARLRAMNVPMVGSAAAWQQALVAAVISTLNLPVYLTVEVEDQQKARRLLEQFSQRIFLKGGDVGGLRTELDAYRLPNYKEHPIYVLSTRLYAVTLRLHIALVGDQLVISTTPEVLRQAIDASQAEAQSVGPAHVLLRLNREALRQLHSQVQLYWSEKSRLACHNNVSSVFILHKLYGIPLEDVQQVSEAKYGVRYYCPDGGRYAVDESGGQVACSIHGNRQHSKQHAEMEATSSFARFEQSVEQILAALRFQEEALMVTVDIARRH